MSDVEYERYFNFATIWAFAGTLEVENRESFSNWWKEQFEHHIEYPEEGMVSLVIIIYYKILSQLPTLFLIMEYSILCSGRSQL